MKNFTYYRPKTAEAAVALLDAKWGTCELLAGGTDLHDLQKEYVAQPDKVVSLGAIGLTINPATDTIYVANIQDTSVSLINGATTQSLAAARTKPAPRSGSSPVAALSTRNRTKRLARASSASCRCSTR